MEFNDIQDNVDMMDFVCPVLYPLILNLGHNDKEQIKKTIIDYASSDEVAIDMFNIMIIDEVCKEEGLTEWYENESGISNYLLSHILIDSLKEE